MRIAIIGYGGMGHYHGLRVKEIESFDIAGIYDTDTKRQEFAAQNGLFVYNSYEQVANDDSVDGVIIATPNDSHPFYMEYFVNAGKKVLCEKPVTNTPEEFEKVLGNTRDGIVTVNQNRRYDHDFLIVQKIITENKIGKVYRIESRVTGANGIPGGWRKLKQYGGGMMLDWGVHLIDQVCMMFPKISSISCNYSYALGFDVEDGFLLTINTACGVQVVIEVQTNDYIGAPRWKVFGRDGSAVIENWHLEGRITVPIYNSNIETVAISAGNGLTKTMAYRHHDTVTNLPLPEVQVDVDAIYKNLKQVKKHDDLIVKGHEVMRVLKIMQACKVSADNGGALIELSDL